MVFKRKPGDTVFFWVKPGNVIEAKIAEISGIGSDPRCRYRLMTGRGYLHEHVFDEEEIFDSKADVVAAQKPAKGGHGIQEDIHPSWSIDAGTD